VKFTTDPGLTLLKACTGARSRHIAYGFRAQARDAGTTDARHSALHESQFYGCLILRLYNQGRPHLSLGPGIPDPAALFLPLQGQNRHSFAQDCKVVAHAVLGGLPHEYQWERIAA
jgi:hypothetical protein